MRKTTLILSCVGILMFMWSVGAVGQEDESNSRLFVIHEDVVMPARVAEYEQAIKTVLVKLNELKMTSLRHVVTVSEDFHYAYIAEIDNMAALDNDPWDELEKKMGKEAWDEMWKGYDNTYAMHHDFLARLRPNLSYDPKNASMGSEEMTFRHWDYYYVDPDEGDTAREIAKEWKALYESKGVPTGYRLYTGGLGTEVPLYVVVQWASNAAEYEAQNAKALEMLGEEGQALMQRTLAISRRVESKNGWLRPDLSYMPPEEITAK
ncbi:MAG: hypothetical protein ACE5IY_17555 [bacterium]